MGKGGQKAAASTQPQVWKSPYNPLAKDAPKLPTKGEIKASIPAECFQRSYIWGILYLARDLTISAAFAYATSLVLSTDIPSDPVELVKYVLGWSFYAFWQGTIWTGPWVIAHECGHGAFSPSQTWNDICWIHRPPSFASSLLCLAIHSRQAPPSYQPLGRW